MALPWQMWGAEGVRLLLVNGLGSPMVSYEVGFLEQLVTAGFQVVRFDNRDAGKASRCDAPYSVSDMAADAVAVLDDVGWDQAHVFGQSMGGMIVQQMAIDAPQRLLSMTSLMSTTGETSVGRSSDEAMAALMKPPPTDREGWIGARIETEKLWASPALWDPEWVRAKAGLMYDYGVDSKGAARQYRAIVSSGSRDAGLAQVDLPALVMHGDADTLVNVDGGRHTAKVIPNAQYVEIEGMGHDLPPKLWSRLVNELSDFALS